MSLFGLVLCLLFLLDIGFANGKPNFPSDPEEETILSEAERIHLHRVEIGSAIRNGLRSQRPREEIEAENKISRSKKHELGSVSERENYGEMQSLVKIHLLENISDLNMKRRQLENIRDRGTGDIMQSVTTRNRIKNLSRQETEENSKPLKKMRQLQVTPPQNRQLENIADLQTVGECDALEILGDLLGLALATTNFTFGLITDGSLIVAELSTCLNQFNPFNLIGCFYDLFRTVPGQIRDIVEGTRYFAATARLLAPALYHSVESCVGRGNAEHRDWLESLLAAGVRNSRE